VLEVVGSVRETGEIIVISGFGPSADWFRNLQAAPAAEIAIGRRRFRPQHRIIDETEASGVLADYERRNRIIAPIVRQVLGWLAGWRYDGSDSARARLVRQLPMVAFRPTTTETSRAGADLRGWSQPKSEEMHSSSQGHREEVGP
jgi:deazaflavin-dependent oxidoreductase (nitroreductase family)